MKIATRRIISALTGIVLIAAGVGGCVYFVKTKPQAKRRQPMSSMVPVVEAIPLERSSQSVKVECLGTVIADRDAAIQAEVSGRIVAVNPNMVEGARFKKGDILVEIEDVDYRIALLKAEAGLLAAQSNLRIEEGQQDVVRHELELMGGDVSDSYRDLILRQPQLRSAQAAVTNAMLVIESAKLSLERTRIRAPFDAIVVSVDADVGDYAQTSKALIDLVATDRYFIRASVSLEALAPLPELGTTPYPATVTLSDGTIRTAQTHKLLPDLTEKGRMARILLVVDDPLDLNGRARPLLLNEYVHVRISGRTVEGAALIPRKYLRDGDVVWMIDSSRKLRVLPVELFQSFADEVLVRVDAEAGMKLITTDLSAVVDGMQLRRVGDPVSTPQKDGNKGEGRSKKQQGA